MSKNTLYLIAAILALIIIAIIWAPKTPLIAQTASPVNGLVDSAHPSASMEKPASEAVSQAGSPAAVEPPKGKAMDADDVPAGVEVAPAPTPSIQKPTEDKGMVIPPSEGQ